MSYSSAMRLFCQKVFGFKIELMRWCNRMNLLAISTDKGEVIIRRLNFQRIWTHPPPRDGVKIRGIDFRPDEKIIAIGYNTGLVVLLDIGSQHEIYSFNLNSDITCFGWTQNSKEIEDHCNDDSPFAVSLDQEQQNMFKKAFAMFDTGKTGSIEKEKVRTILNTLGHTYDDTELLSMLDSEDVDGTGKLNFESFCRVALHFNEEVDDKALQKELKEAFRLYDKEGNGFIPISSLREILGALDDQLTGEQRNEMIAEIDTDQSGTVDFDEFMEMMTGD